MPLVCNQTQTRAKGLPAKTRAPLIHSGCNLMAECLLPKQTARVRFPSPDPLGPLAHAWLEQQTHNLLVLGSTPRGPTSQGGEIGKHSRLKICRRIALPVRVRFLAPGAEMWPSGRRHSPAKGAGVKSTSEVRIFSSPPESRRSCDLPCLVSAVAN